MLLNPKHFLFLKNICVLDTIISIILFKPKVKGKLGKVSPKKKAAQAMKKKVKNEGKEKPTEAKRTEGENCTAENIFEDLQREKTCTECDENFVSFTKWMAHIMSSGHEDYTDKETSFYCFTCERYFTCLTGLEHHMKITHHTGNPKQSNRERRVVPMQLKYSKSKKYDIYSFSFFNNRLL